MTPPPATDDHGEDNNVDRAVQPPSDIYRDQSRLPGDYNSPASPPVDVPKGKLHDFPAEDTDLDSHEVYDAGTRTASDADTFEEDDNLKS